MNSSFIDPLVMAEKIGSIISSEWEEKGTVLISSVVEGGVVHFVHLTDELVLDDVLFFFQKA